RRLVQLARPEGGAAIGRPGAGPGAARPVPGGDRPGHAACARPADREARSRQPLGDRHGGRGPIHRCREEQLPQRARERRDGLDLHEPGQPGPGAVLFQAVALISVMGMQLPCLISGATILGIVLSLPTTGPLFLRALVNHDTYLAGTFLLMLSAMLMLGNLLADILLAWADPRIRYE